MRRGFSCVAPYGLRPSNSTDGSFSILRPSITPIRWYRNINLLSIDYAFRPRLRIRLTLGGRTFPRKPWAFGDQDSHLVFRYSCLHGHFCTVHARLHLRFNPVQNALLPRELKFTSASSVIFLVPIIFGAKPLDQ